MDEYKLAHEAFMANHAGTYAGNLILCVAHAPALLWMLKIIQGHKGSVFWVEYVVLVLPMLFIITLWSEYLFITTFLVYLPVVAAVIHQLRSPTRCAITPAIDDTLSTAHASTAYLTHFKGFNVLLTCLSILAVDFPVFPRSFAKTETFGISLMDIGVGTFIVSSAVTSKFARGALAMSSGATRCTSYISRVFSLQHILVLLLGVGRLVALKALNYQEHVSEYGVHWNFFVTLSCVWSAADVMHTCLPRTVQLALAVLTVCVYQLLLQTTSLTDYLMSSTRDWIVSANKEGIVSLLGYIPLYMITEYLANSLFYTDLVPPDVAKEVDAADSKERECGKARWNLPLMRNLSVVSMLLWSLWWGCASFVQPTSRRLVNAAYIALALALCFTMILVLYVADTAAHGPAVPVLTLQYLSKHSLVVFLAANLLTGAVNLSMRTIYASNATALGVLAAYGLAIVAAAWLAEQFSLATAPKIRT